VEDSGESWIRRFGRVVLDMSVHQRSLHEVVRQYWAGLRVEQLNDGLVTCAHGVQTGDDRRHGKCLRCLHQRSHRGMLAPPYDAGWKKRNSRAHLAEVPPPLLTLAPGADQFSTSAVSVPVRTLAFVFASVAGVHRAGRHALPWRVTWLVLSVPSSVLSAHA
jgi:hypothetical protein